MDRTYNRTLVTACWAVVLLSSMGMVGCADEVTPDDEDGITEQDSPSSGDDGDDEAASDDEDGDAKKDAGKKVDAGGAVDAGRKSDSGALIDAGAKSDAAVVEASPDAGGGSGGDASLPDEEGEDLGEGDGKDVITIGDSWMNLTRTSGIEQSLEKVSGRDYRNFGVSGTRLLDEVIPRQYASAKAQDPDIKTVVMTGGGNDILQAKLLDCVDSAFGDACKAQIDMVGARLVKLWEEMSKDGVRDVVIIGYTKKAMLLGTLVKSAEYSNETIPPLCAAVKPPLRCHALDADMVFDGTLRDGIHPTDPGYDAIAKGVWELMQKEGMRR